MKHLPTNSGKLTVFLMTLSVIGCAAAVTIGAGCDFYRAQRLVMPDISATGDFLSWFNQLDAGMLAVCR